jgi:hypothetical protein
MLATLFELYKKFGENVGPAVDILVSLGILRDSKRRNKKVVNEKWWPTGALDAWHVSRYSQLMTRVSSNRQQILDIWTMTLEEPQQHHFKIGVANMSWADVAAKEQQCIDGAVAFLNEMALQPNDDARTAKADARDFIKDPATEYPIVFLERVAGRKFTDPDDLRKWITDNWDKLGHSISARVKTINKAINRRATPANAVTGAPANPGGLLAQSETALNEARARYLASKRR